MCEPCASWWRHQMEAFSALLAFCAGNSPVPGEFPSQRPVTRSFDVFFDMCLNKQVSKQSWGWWSETPPSSLWRQCNVFQSLLIISPAISLYTPYECVCVPDNYICEHTCFLFDIFNCDVITCLDIIAKHSKSFMRLHVSHHIDSNNTYQLTPICHQPISRILMGRCRNQLCKQCLVDC